MCHIYSKEDGEDMRKIIGEDVHRFFQNFMTLMPRYASPLYCGWHEGAFRGDKRMSYEAEALRMSFYQELRTICCAEMSKKLIDHFFSGHGGRNEADKLIFHLCDGMVKNFVAKVGFRENPRHSRSGTEMRRRLQQKLNTARIEA